MTWILFLATLVGGALLGLDVAIPSVLMGLGIAIDVMLATIAKFRDDDLSFKNWTLPIMATHIGFPAIGYYGFWGMSQAWPWLHPVLGIVGALFVFLFIYEVAGEWIGYKPRVGISSGAAWLVSKISGIDFDENSGRRMVAILAVSWDALWSGPAKSEAIGPDWTTSDIGWSFMVAGLVVAFAAQLSLKIALRMREHRFSNAEKMTLWSMSGKYLETSVIGGFGVLSLFQGLGITDSIWLSMGVSMVLMLMVFIIFGRDILRNTFEETYEVLGEYPVADEEEAP
jgi:hypothetical protein